MSSLIYYNMANETIIKNALTIDGPIDPSITISDAFIKWDSLNTILRIDGTGTYDGLYIGDPDGDAIVFEGTDMSLSSSTGDAGAYAINNATGGSMALQLKASTAFNSTLEVPEASGTIALTSDLDGSGGTLSNYLPLAGGTMTGLANIDMDGGQITNISYLNSPSGSTDGWDGITGRFLEAEDTLTAPGFFIDASGNCTWDPGNGGGGAISIENTNFSFTGSNGGIFLTINPPASTVATTDIIFNTDGGVAFSGTLSFDGDNTTANRTWTFPDASGTIALLSDISGGVNPFNIIANSAPLTETVDWDNGESQEVDFELKGAGAVVFTLSNPVNGASYTLKITQGANLNTITWPASIKWEGGTPLVPTATDNAIDVVTMVYDGTNYFASYGTNFS